MKDCEHDWNLEDKDTKLRAFISFAASWEEPRYYPPAGFLAVEVCSKCHLIRVPFVGGKKEAIE